MDNLTQDGVIIAVVAMATQVLKPLLPKKVLPLITWIFGGIIGGIISWLTSGNIVEGSIRGLIAGGASNGAYAQIKRLKPTRCDDDVSGACDRNIAIRTRSRLPHA